MSLDQANEILDVCHASESIVRIPNWQHKNPKNPKPSEDRDFGAGFYMCKTVDQWYPIGLYAGFDNIERVILNEYKLLLDTSALKILRLKADLIWTLVIAAHRHENAGNRAEEKRQWRLLRGAVLGAVKQYDLIIGPVSNDRMYTVLDDFIDNKVSEGYVVESVNYMKYPMQYVSKSEKADKQISFVASRELSPEEIMTAKTARVAEYDEMNVSMTERRIIEREAVKNGNANGRLFKDLVSSSMSEMEGASEDAQKQHLRGLVERWFRDGKW